MRISKLNLSNVTLVCVDGSKNSKEAKKVFDRVRESISFYDAIFKDDITSIIDYNDYIINYLHADIKTDFCMIIQADGFPINLDAWDDLFLKYDYIGAPWYSQPWPLEKTVGNGGFSIRSKKMLQESSELAYDKSSGTPEDVFLCRMKDQELKSRGIVFAPHDVAYRFSVEDMYYKGQFGFHGKNTINLNAQVGIFK